MTKLEALTQTIQLWEYLAQNPHVTHKPIAIIALDLQRDMIADCPACQYNDEQLQNDPELEHEHPGSCHFCPVWDCTDGVEEKCAGDGHDGPEAYYAHWRRATTPQKRAKAAWSIVSMAQTRLAALTEETSA